MRRSVRVTPKRFSFQKRKKVDKNDKIKSLQRAHFEDHILVIVRRNTARTWCRLDLYKHTLSSADLADPDHTSLVTIHFQKKFARVSWKKIKWNKMIFETAIQKVLIKLKIFHLDHNRQVNKFQFKKWFDELAMYCMWLASQQIFSANCSY